jgi:hypothetical protein
MTAGKLAQLLSDLTTLRNQCEQLAGTGNPQVRQMAAADVGRITLVMESLRRLTDADAESVSEILGSWRPYGSQIRDRLAVLMQEWQQAQSFGLPEGNEDDLFERIRRYGSLITYQDWDSGGPGAGAGRDCVYLYYSTHDAGLPGPFATEAEACRSIGI